VLKQYDVHINIIAELTEERDKLNRLNDPSQIISRIGTWRQGTRNTEEKESIKEKDAKRKKAVESAVRNWTREGTTGLRKMDILGDMLDKKAVNRDGVLKDWNAEEKAIAEEVFSSLCSPDTKVKELRIRQHFRRYRSTGYHDKIREQCSFGLMHQDKVLIILKQLRHQVYTNTDKMQRLCSKRIELRKQLVEVNLRLKDANQTYKLSEVVDDIIHQNLEEEVEEPGDHMHNQFEDQLESEEEIEDDVENSILLPDIELIRERQMEDTILRNQARIEDFE
jgi:hypothetical protein